MCIQEPNCYQSSHAFPREGSTSNERHDPLSKNSISQQSTDRGPESSDISTSLGLLLGSLDHRLGIASATRVIHFGVTRLAAT
jgi:hypothetical protein